jgi:hypothetical protein
VAGKTNSVYQSALHHSLSSKRSGGFLQARLIASGYNFGSRKKIRNGFIGSLGRG